jgi:hypothetical protein
MQSKNISTLLEEEWERRWTRSPHYRQSRYWFPKTNKRQTCNLLKHGRITLGLMTQFFTGFNWLSYHQSKIEKTHPPPPCRLCGMEREETIHLVSACPSLWTLRRDTFSGDQPTNWTTSQVYRFITDRRVMNMLAPPDRDEEY